MLKLLKDKYILTATSGFLIFQLVLSFWLWDRTGNVPPSFGDAYAYTFEIGKVIKYHHLLVDIPSISQPAQLAYVSYSAILGGLGILTHQNASQVFFASFFWGKLIMALIILYFLSKLLKENHMISLALLTLGLSAGDGAIHGLYWVAPSFFMLATFWLLIASGLTDEISNWKLMIICGIYIFIHPISAYTLVVIAIYAAIIWITTKRVPSGLILVVFWMLIFIIIYQYLKFTLPHNPVPEVVPQSYYLVTKIDNPVPSLHLFTITFIDKWIEQNTGVISKLIPGFIPTYNSYFSWFARFPILIPGFGYCLYLTYKHKQVKVWGLYISCLAFTLAAIFNPFGYRSLIFLVPITLIVISSGIYLFWNEIHSKFRKAQALLKMCIVFVTIFVLVFLAAFSAKTVKLQAKTTDLTLNTTECNEFLINSFQNNQNVFFTSVESINIFLNQGLEKYNLRGINTLSPDLIRKGAYILTEDDSVINSSNIDMSLKDNFGYSGRLSELAARQTVARCRGFKIIKIN